MSTRTSISMTNMVDSAVKQRMTGFQKMPIEYTSSQYLLFCYAKPVLEHFHATALFQAAKGLVTCEVGVSRSEELPYYRYFDSPLLGVSGFRARTGHILRGVGSVTTKRFVSPDSLAMALQELAAEAESAHKKLLELALPRISAQYAIWQPLYSAWLEAEGKASQVPDRRYPGLVGEGVARRIINDLLARGHFDNFLGHKNKLRYHQPAFMNCHVYLLAKALAFIEPPENSEISLLALDPGQNPDQILFDPIAALTGRSEQDEAIELTNKITSRVPEWAFLSSFAALEAFFEKTVVELASVKSCLQTPPPATPAAKAEVKQPVKESAPAPSLSLDDLYEDSPSLLANSSLDALPPLESAPALESINSVENAPVETDLRPDPFEQILPFLENKGETQVAIDPFDLLGAQLGL